MSEILNLLLLLGFFEVAQLAHSLSVEPLGAILRQLDEDGAHRALAAICITCRSDMPCRAASSRR
jgi:hypothetical protein